MWLEAMYASMSVAGVCGVTMAVNAIFPAETKRFLRIVRAEVESRLPDKHRKVTIDLAIHADIAVDMAWWDKQFAKAVAQTPTGQWAKMVERRMERGGVYDRPPYMNSSDLRWGTRHLSPEPPTAAEINYRIAQEKSVLSITDGNLTYRNHYTNGAEALRWDVRESRKLVEEGIHAAQTDPAPAPECEFCEYVETWTYASSAVRRYKAELCWECAEKDRRGRKTIQSLSSVGYALGAGYITFPDAQKMVEDIANRT